MGSPLGPTISKFYMSYIENKIFKTIITKPKIYVCYLDDILSQHTPTTKLSNLNKF